MKNISSNLGSLDISKNFNINNYNPSSRSNSTMSYENVNVDCTTSSDSSTESIDVMAPLHLADSVKEIYYPNASNNLSNEEIMEQWITYIKTTVEQLEAEKKKFIEDHYFKFNKAHFDDLLIDQVTGEYLTPEQYKYSEDALETFLLNNGYPINDHVDPNKYLEGVDAFHEVEVKRYSELYSKYFKEITGITYEEYVDQINTYNSDISSLKSSKYSLEQQLKESPYLDLIETDAYKKFYEDNPNLYQEIIEIYDSGKYKIFNDSLYVDASCITEDYIYNGSDNVVTIDGKIYYKYQSPDDYKKDSQALETYLVNHGYSIDPFYDPIAYNKGVEEFNNYIDTTFNSNFNYEFLYSMINTKDGAYLNEDEKKIYIYLLCNEGNDAAADYLVAIEDRINQRKGKEEADRFLASITDENGEINYNALTMLLANGQGILMGIENFGEGLANIFGTEGMISDNQYAQMYILDALTNTSGAYVNSLAEVILEEKGEKEATEFINNMIDTTTGEINLEYAKEVLTEEEYTKLEYKIKKDKETILDDSFQMGASFGNMLPSMAITMALSYCGAAPAATSLIGNVLMGLSSGGNAKNQALVSGNDLLSSTIYGILSGTSETCLGLLLGNIPGLNESASLSFKGIFKEGFEEFLQEYVDAGLRCAILGEEINLDELNQDAIKSFVFGVLMSFGTNAASMGVKLIINGKSVELNSMADVKAFFQILNDSGILIENRTEDGVGKTIIIDESITNKSEMVDIMKSIYKDAEIFIKTADGNISYAGYSGYDVGSDSSITTGDSMDQVGFQFFGGKNDNAVNSIIYNNLITGMEAHDAKYGQGSAINELYNYLYSGGDITKLSLDGEFRRLVGSIGYNGLISYYNIIVDSYNNTGTYKTKSSDKSKNNYYVEKLLNKGISYEKFAEENGIEISDYKSEFDMAVGQGDLNWYLVNVLKSKYGEMTDVEFRTVRQAISKPRSELNTEELYVLAYPYLTENNFNDLNVIASHPNMSGLSQQEINTLHQFQGAGGCNINLFLRGKSKIDLFAIENLMNSQTNPQTKNNWGHPREVNINDTIVDQIDRIIENHSNKTTVKGVAYYEKSFGSSAPISNVLQTIETYGAYSPEASSAMNGLIGLDITDKAYNSRTIPSSKYTNYSAKYDSGILKVKVESYISPGCGAYIDTYGAFENGLGEMLIKRNCKQTIIDSYIDFKTGQLVLVTLYT